MPRADNPAPSRSEKPSRSLIQHLIRELGSHEFKDRQSASQQLEKIGRPALNDLRAAAASDKDPEVRRRAARTVDAIQNTLGQLLVEYRAWGLPMPPKDARLVRYDLEVLNWVGGHATRTGYGLAFELKPVDTTGSATLMQGSVIWHVDWDTDVQAIPPNPAAVKDLDSSLDGLGLAIQCHARGWRELAEYLLARDRKASRTPARQELLHMAWDYLENQITSPNPDRASISKRLHQLITRDGDLDTKEHRRLIRSLDLALVPSSARPGTVEYLIDGLVDDTGVTPTSAPLEPGDAYWHLTEMGFDSVPACIAHLDDDRLTRGRMQEVNTSRHMRLGNVVGDLLERLAGHDLGPAASNRRVRGHYIQQADAKTWWDEVRQTGEKRYLLEHVLPPDSAQGEAEEINVYQLRVICVKYPDQIAELYRAVLNRRHSCDSRPLAEALIRSKLSRKVKLDLLLNAAHDRCIDHHVPALWAIQKLDQKQFDVLLGAAIRAFPRDVDGPYSSCAEAAIANLAIKSGAPEVWLELEKAARRAVLGLRMELFGAIGDTDPAGRPNDDAHRRERVGVLAAFLKDRTVRDKRASAKYERTNAGFMYRTLEVRNLAAFEIARLLRIRAELQPTDPTPAEWSRLRHQVRQRLMSTKQGPQTQNHGEKKGTR